MTPTIMKPLGMKPMRLFLAGVALSALAACATDPLGHQTAGIDAPAAWNDLPAKKGAQVLASSDKVTVEQRWWHSFGDPTLDRLVDTALANNKTLAQAEARVAEARAQRAGSVAQLLPEVQGSGDFQRGNQGFASNNKAITIKEGQLQASWEVDLFGKNQARAAAAGAILESEDARRQAAMVSLLAEVARNYFDLRNDQTQIDITEKNLGTQQRTLDLIQVQFKGALANQLDVSRAAAQVATTSARLPTLRAAYATTMNHLNILLGDKPGTNDGWIAPPQAMKPLSPTILVAAPATVLASRPDIRAAERNFAASVSTSKAASKEIFPTISLTSFFGIQDSSLFANANPWGAAAGLTQPILEFGRIQADIDTANARQKQAYLGYQETVLEGLEDMENALALYFNESSRQHDLATAADQDRRAVDLANRQYQAGYTGLLDLLVAQQSELDAESSLAASDAELRKNLVHIYTAAGGGWDLDTRKPRAAVAQTAAKGTASNPS
ncbi:MAG TPA: TolC family protein [Stellaceae bacterium]|nr:TolC family protein [Stellaceae bacterium]